MLAYIFVFVWSGEDTKVDVWGGTVDGCVGCVFELFEFIVSAEEKEDTVSDERVLLGDLDKSGDCVVEVAGLTIGRVPSK